MVDKVETPVSGGDDNKGAPDGVNTDPGARSGGPGSGSDGGGGESDGGAYPNPHTGKNGDGGQGGFTGHGGQSEIAYSGTGQGGHDDDKDVGNKNAVTE